MRTEGSENMEPMSLEREKVYVRRLRPDDLDLHNAYIGSLRASKEFDGGLSFYGGLLDEPS